MFVTGDKDCVACQSHPSHVLQPCQHKVCFKHIIEYHTREKSSVQICTLCRQVIIAAIQSAHTRAAFKPSLSFTTSSTTSSSSSTANLQPANETQKGAKLPWVPPGAGYQRSATAMQSFGHPGFVPATPVQQPSFMRQPPSQPAGYQHGGNSPLPRSNSVISLGNAMSPAHAPYASATPHGGMRSFSGPNPMMHADYSQIMRIPEVTTSNNHAQEYDSLTPLRSPPRPPAGPTRANALANIIKAGAAETPDMSPIREVESPQRWRETSRSNGPIVQDLSPNGRSPPPVQHWRTHMVDIIADPPFMQASNADRLPNVEEAINYMPFIEPTSSFEVPQHGVIVVKNIPYASTKAEIIAAIGRNSRIVSQPPGSPFYAIHIIMERATGKTMDCYVELESKQEARGIVAAYRSRLERNRAPRVGDRHVDIDLASQDELMTQMFPKAKCVLWDGAIPNVTTSDEWYDSGFRGFILEEELAMIWKHAESPARSPFVARAPNRSFEAIISILFKYPWYKPGLVSIEERSLIFVHTVKMLRLLIKNIQQNTNPLQLTQLLLQEFVCAALTVPFSHKQKNEVVEVLMSNGYETIITSIGYEPMTEHSSFWPFEVLDKKPGVRSAVIEYYAALLNRASLKFAQDLNLNDDEAAELLSNPFGAHRIKHMNDAIKGMNLSAAATAEWHTIWDALCEVLPRPMAQSSSGASSASFSSSGDGAGAPLNSPTPAPSTKRGGMQLSQSMLAQDTNYQRPAPLHSNPASPPFDPTPGAHLKRNSHSSAGRGGSPIGRGMTPSNSMSRFQSLDEIALSPAATIDSHAAFSTPEKKMQSSEIHGLGSGVGFVPPQISYAGGVKKDYAKDPVKSFNPEAAAFTSPLPVRATPAVVKPLSPIGSGRGKSFTELAAARGITVSSPQPKTVSAVDPTKKVSSSTESKADQPCDPVTPVKEDIDEGVDVTPIKKQTVSPVKAEFVTPMKKELDGGVDLTTIKEEDV